MTKFSYQTVSQAINELQKRGFEIDFNLDENLEAFDSGEYNSDDYEIVEVHRYEGNSDPADEAVVYAIQLKKGGMKGVLVSGYGYSAGRRAQKFIQSLQHIPTPE